MFDVLPMKRKSPIVHFVVFSPDNIPIRPDPFHSRAAAENALQEWVKRYQHQGFYFTVRWERIPLANLAALCRIEP
jgi:hypothetical protein